MTCLLWSEQRYPEQADIVCCLALPERLSDEAERGGPAYRSGPHRRGDGRSAMRVRPGQAQGAVSLSHLARVRATFGAGMPLWGG